MRIGWWTPGIVLFAVPTIGGCPSPSASTTSITATTGESSSSAGESSSVGVTVDATVDPDDDSSGGTGCIADEDCADDPGGPHCDPFTSTCVGECVPATTRPCYSGPPNTEGMGACVAGTQPCSDEGMWELWCDGEVVPNSDDCNDDGVDDDCDGLVDDTDLDGDGFGRCAADCCDVDGGGCEGAALVNPGAFEVVGNEVDDDCDGDVDEVEPECDSGLGSSSGDARDYARAIELCSFTEEEPSDPAERTWGVIDATFSRADGTGSPLAVQRSLRGGFGELIDPENGDRLAVLSTGHAADADDANPAFASFQSGQNLGTTSAAPADWLASNAGVFPNPSGCLEPWDTDAHDPIMLRLRMRVPTNARSFSVQMQFFSAEYPEYVCSEFNDFFVALVDSTADNPADKNIAIYDDGDTTYPVGVNLVMVADGLFTQCENGVVGCEGMPGEYDGCVGDALLEGTGFDAYDNGCGGGQSEVGGGTGWLRMSGNVTPGEVMELRLAIWDSSGHLFDSLVLLDDWRWSLDGAMPGVAPG